MFRFLLTGDTPIWDIQKISYALHSKSRTVLCLYNTYAPKDHVVVEDLGLIYDNGMVLFLLRKNVIIK